MNEFFDENYKNFNKKDTKRFSYLEFSNMMVAILEDVYIKNDKEAIRNETLESAVNYENYINAIEKVDTFEMHQYDLMDIKGLNIGDSDREFIYASENDMIPNEFRQTLLELKRSRIIDEFEELNDYYRTLMGLPKYGDESEYIYLDLESIDTTRMYIEDKTLPLHELTSYVQDILISSGEIDKLKKKYGYKYLDFIGSKAIPLRLARDAKDFDLIRCSPRDNVDRTMLSSFKRLYGINRNYMLNVFMIDYSNESQKLYHPFFSLMIVMITVNAIISENLERLIGREYIDDFNYDVFLESYKLHSLKGLSLRYKKILVKNFNYLLKYKGSDKVIVDICKLFGFKNTRLMKTYLTKKHNFNGTDPIFRYMEDSEGNQVLDSEAMYDLKFVDIPYDSDNITYEINNSDIVLDYDAIAYNDNYWGGGEISKEAMKQQILKINFNQILTKYVSLNNMYNITELSFETSYVFSLIFKLRHNISGMCINLNGLINNNAPLFDTIIYLYCLFMKKYNYTGEIIGSFSSNLSFKGFNANSDMAYLKRLVEELEIDINLDKLTYAGATNDVSVIEELYLKFKELREKVYIRMINSENITEYTKLKSIYDGIMHTKLNEELYIKNDGVVARTYKELLEDINPTLNNRLENYVDSDNIVDEIAKLLDVLDTTINQGNLNYLFTNIEIMELSRIHENLFTIINFFKAHTVQLRDINTIYTIDDKYLNFIKAIDQVTKTNLTYRQLILKVALDNYSEIFKMKDTTVETISMMIVDKVTKIITLNVLTEESLYKTILDNYKSNMSISLDNDITSIRDDDTNIDSIIKQTIDKVLKYKNTKIDSNLQLDRYTNRSAKGEFKVDYSTVRDSIFNRDIDVDILIAQVKDKVIKMNNMTLSVGSELERLSRKNSNTIINTDTSNEIYLGRSEVEKVLMNISLIKGRVEKILGSDIEFGNNSYMERSIKRNIGSEFKDFNDIFEDIKTDTSLVEDIELISSSLMDKITTIYRLSVELNNVVDRLNIVNKTDSINIDIESGMETSRNDSLDIISNIILLVDKVTKALNTSLDVKLEVDRDISKSSITSIDSKVDTDVTPSRNDSEVIYNIQTLVMDKIDKLTSMKLDLDMEFNSSIIKGLNHITEVITSEDITPSRNDKEILESYTLASIDIIDVIYKTLLESKDLIDRYSNIHSKSRLELETSEDITPSRNDKEILRTIIKELVDKSTKIKDLKIKVETEFIKYFWKMLDFNIPITDDVLYNIARNPNIDMSPKLRMLIDKVDKFNSTSINMVTEVIYHYNLMYRDSINMASDLVHYSKKEVNTLSEFNESILNTIGARKDLVLGLLTNVTMNSMISKYDKFNEFITYIRKYNDIDKDITLRLLDAVSEEVIDSITNLNLEFNQSIDNLSTLSVSDDIDSIDCEIDISRYTGLYPTEILTMVNNIKNIVINHNICTSLDLVYELNSRISYFINSRNSMDIIEFIELYSNINRFDSINLKDLIEDILVDTSFDGGKIKVLDGRVVFDSKQENNILDLKDIPYTDIFRGYDIGSSDIRLKDSISIEYS